MGWIRQVAYRIHYSYRSKVISFRWELTNHESDTSAASARDRFPRRSRAPGRPGIIAGDRKVCPVTKYAVGEPSE